MQIFYNPELSSVFSKAKQTAQRRKIEKSVEGKWNTFDFGGWRITGSLGFSIASHVRRLLPAATEIFAKLWVCVNLVFIKNQIFKCQKHTSILNLFLFFFFLIEPQIFLRKSLLIDKLIVNILKISYKLIFNKINK